MKRIYFLWLLLALLPGLASAWWNEEWSFKKKISLDLQKIKQENITVPVGGFVLLRLHTGNFVSFMELSEKGKDIRVLAGDEKTPLKFYIEKLDPVNEMALIWVKLTQEVTASPEPSLWLYYGNETAVDGQEPAATYGNEQVLSYQFTGKSVKDITANTNNPSEANNSFAESGLIGESAVFQGSQIIRIPATPTLSMLSATGWTVSAWLKIDQPQQDAVIFERSGATGSVTLAIKENTPTLEVVDASGSKQEFKAQAALTTAAWQQVAITATADKLVIFVNGVASSELAVKVGDLTSDMTLGANGLATRGFVGAIDQFAVYKIARDANAIKFDVLMQGTNTPLLTYGEDTSPDSEEGESYFLSTLNNVTVDGWVVIGILSVMFVISFIVMITKAIKINKTHATNKLFEDAFSKLDNQHISELDKGTLEPGNTAEETYSLFSLTSEHNTFADSSIYRIYHVGVQEMNKRLRTKSGNMDEDEQGLSAGSMAAVKASMDAVLVRELQKLNSSMVLLTIAISGGPFLGLLGTVVGVMITFAAIAVSGEVNVNAIAPGIAAALAATVAGLVVAIPALFGYNYLGSRIKIVSADMQVFVDEFVAKLAEQHT